MSEARQDRYQAMNESNARTDISLRLRRRVTAAIAAFAAAIAVTNALSLVFALGETVRSTVLQPVVWHMAGIALLLALLSLRPPRWTGAVLVTVIVAVAIYAGVDARPGDLTSVALLFVGLTLADELGLTQASGRHLVPATIALFLISLIGSYIVEGMSPLRYAGSVLGAVCLSYLLWVLLSARAERHRMREVELEERVKERTADLRRQMEETKALEEERKVLLREVHHRTRNNMQVITSLLNVEEDRKGSPEAHAAVSNTRNRIAVLGFAHDQLFRSESVVRVRLRTTSKPLRSTCGPGQGCRKWSSRFPRRRALRRESTRRSLWRSWCTRCSAPWRRWHRPWRTRPRSAFGWRLAVTGGGLRSRRARRPPEGEVSHRTARREGWIRT